jgi:hypothetical protein
MLVPKCRLHLFGTPHVPPSARRAKRTAQQTSTLNLPDGSRHYQS